MSDQTPKSPIQQKVVDYFSYISLYEKELYLSPQPQQHPPSITTPQAKSKPKQPMTISQNPYPEYSPHNDLVTMHSAIGGCIRCALGSSRNKFVFGVGSKEAKVVFVGEAPGAEEDKQGFPFVGRAGKLLDHLLNEIGWSREEVYICNILKCRPPNNRDPVPDEIEQCEPYLHEQLRILNPQFLVALGRVAAQTLLRTNAPLRELRGRVHSYQDKPFWVIYHPAALLRNQNLMPDTVKDLLTLKKMVETGQADAGIST
ncbi:uracil-DNA glycosylase [bacterium]|nr:uracil-DNA glycosylase [bacterium]MBU1653104.1 uracil-DNA glycosylase [bacterium]MBU1881339.1 uracil-DNA glycosylase [bacterium]